MRKLILSILAGGMLAAVGCGSSNAEFLTEDRKANGLVIILPGIEGESPMNRDIRRGLVSAGVYRALPIYRWGRPIPLAGMLLNQIDILGNRLEGMKIARMIEDYQDSHPGKPVFLIGHSGGGGVAVFAAEALKEGRQVEGLVLLSASISSAYNLTKALKKCRHGVVNFYSQADIGLLKIGTTIAGNVDGIHGPAAGAIGFDMPTEKDSPDKRLVYGKLYQVELTDPSLGDAHSAATRAGFVSAFVAPWITATSWPATGSFVRRPDCTLYKILVCRAERAVR